MASVNQWWARETSGVPVVNSGVPVVPINWAGVRVRPYTKIENSMKFKCFLGGLGYYSC
jgi:hypothetical protein